MPLAVIKSKRKAGKLEVLTKVIRLCAYTITICKNEEHFPKRNRWILTQPIVSESLSLLTCIRRANSVRVETQADYDYRRGQQVEAYAHAESLLTLIELAYACLNLEHERVEYWTGLVLEVEMLLQAWRRSDKETHTRNLDKQTDDAALKKA